MGLDYNSAKLLIWSKSAGVDFSKSAMLGRHCFMGLSETDLSQLLLEAGEDAPTHEQFLQTGYIEPLLKHLGADSVDSFDASSYENATQIWDMNLPVHEQFHERYSLMLDSGTLEHVFNFPSAVRSAMGMVKIGGHLISCVPADGMFGHGLYQFSADLFFSLFSAANGYELVKLFVFQDYRNSPIYEVTDPSRLQRRGALCSNMPALIYAIARRIGEVPARLEVMQSDYLAAWNPESVKPERQTKMRSIGSIFLRRYIKGLVAAAFNFPFFDKAAFVRWHPSKKS